MEKENRASMALENPITEDKKEGKKIGAFRAPQENFTKNDFIYGKLLGLGSYSKVFRVKKKDTGQEYALKVMDKRHIMRENKVQYVKMERLILDQLDHPGVTRLHFTFQDNLYLYMGMECCNGGELFDQIKRRGHLSVEETRFYAAEIVDTLEYIHSEGLIHRDLKPENILFTLDGHVKIADFGSSKMLRSFTNGIITCDPDEKSCTFVGTAEYVAPEVLNSQPITPRVDMWALGCVIFQMLDGRPPFKAASEYLTFQKVMSRDFAMPQQCDPEAKDLIEKLLNLLPENRPDFATIKKHPFFSGVPWSDLWTMPAPSLNLPSGQTHEDWDVAQLEAGLEAFDLSESSESGSASNSQSSSPTANVSREFSTSLSRKRSSASSGGLSGNQTLSEDSTSEQWQRFLNPGEKILETSVVKKYSGMVRKRLQLILTDKPRLAIIDLKKLILKQEISWSYNPNELYVEVDDHWRFSIRTPDLICHFEDVTGVAFGWRFAIEKLQNEHLCKGDGHLSEDEPLESQKDPTELPHFPLHSCGSGQSQTKSTIEPTSEDSPFEIQELAGNQSSQVHLGRVDPQPISLSDGEVLGESSLSCPPSAEVKLVQSAEVNCTDLDMERAVPSEDNKELSSDVKDDYEAAPVDKEKLAFDTTEVDAVTLKSKLTNEDSGSELVLDSNENAVEARTNQLKRIQEQSALKAS